jgi:hypothetical protein
MKIILIIMVLFILAQNSYSQDIEPSLYRFTVNGDSNYVIDAGNNDFKQTRFLTGFIWSGDRRINKALGINSHLEYSEYSMIHAFVIAITLPAILHQIRI